LQSFSSLPVFAKIVRAPDDIALLPDGSLWVSDPTSGTLTHLDGDGRFLESASDGNMPEGIVPLSDGGLVVAEQRTNRLVVTHTPWTSFHTLYQLPPAAHASDGVDGIGFDAARGRILLPDSAGGRLLGVTLDGKATVLASGLGRPVDATIGPDGAIYVAVEGAHGVLRVPAAGGAAQAVGSVTQSDDVIAIGSLLYVTVIDAGHVIALDPRTGAQQVLVDGLSPTDAQGLEVLKDGTIAVADSGGGVIATLQPCGPPGSTPTPSPS
jgi:DNA-binding beta-propeller fold protein YncE